MTSNAQGELLSHLSVLYSSASLFPSRRAFMTPNVSFNGAVASWNEITYMSFLNDVENCAVFWKQRLSLRGVFPGSIIGLWIPGFTYTDAVLVYGISRAGFIPQLISIRLPNSAIVSELLTRSKAAALIYHDAFSSNQFSCSISHCAMESTDICLPDDSDELLPRLQMQSCDDVAIIFHTSGSTSGSPSLIKCTAGWLSSIAYKAAIIASPRASSYADTTVWMGSLCHVAQFTMLIGFLQHGSCTVQPTNINFSSNELQSMILNCGLNRLNQFPTYLSGLMRQAREDPGLLADLRSLDSILFSGLSMSQEDDEWAHKNGLRLTNIFGSTEVGPMMLSSGENGPDADLLSPFPGAVYNFEPVGCAGDERQLLELIVLPSSPDCPPESFRDQYGRFHTGDLFIEVRPGLYSFCGRGDDWIKSENGLRCDTRAIENNVLQLCSDLVESCVVVGTGRPSPALFVEPSADDTEPEMLKWLILQRIRPFNELLYIHERITSSLLVIVVPSMSLPRTATKGNIRRQAVETAFKTQLDDLYLRLKLRELLDPLTPFDSSPDGSRVSYPNIVRHCY